ncbi:MAG: segregation and condensation protein [Solirubrobacterales bacterium]|nr:segregation and condensation protein [Solirubrobacterales bacterium]
MGESVTAEDAGALRALEALFFVSDEPLTTAVLAAALEVDRRRVDDLCAALQTRLEERGSGLVLRDIAGGWRLYSHPETAGVVEQFVLSSRQARLTKAALETLAIVAYKQPVTRHQISAIRGVNSDGVIRALQDRGLVVETGREEGPGRPMLYGTSPEFLERLGLPSLAALPSLAPLLGADAAEDDAADTVADADPEESDAGPEIIEGDGVEIMADMVDGPTSEPAE